jgi:hypothetical protein
VLRSPWLGPLAITIAGIVGYVLSDGGDGGSTLDQVTVTIKETRESGAKWDFGGGMPDPRILVEQAGKPLATCESKDQLKATCRVGAAIDRSVVVNVTVVDVDSSDDDPIGTAGVNLDGGTSTTGSVLAVDAQTSGGGGAWQRFRPLWIALGIGLAIAIVLARYRRRVHAT